LDGVTEVKEDDQCKKKRCQQRQGSEPGFFALHAGRLRDLSSGVKKRSVYRSLARLLQFFFQF
jgi:hypothetical protein